MLSTDPARRSIGRRCLAYGVGAQLTGALFLAGVVPRGGGLLTHWPIPLLVALGLGALVLTVATVRGSTWAGEWAYSAITLMLVSASMGIGALFYWRIFAA